MHITGGLIAHAGLNGQMTQGVIAKEVRWIRVVPQFDRHVVAPDALDECVQRGSRASPHQPDIASPIRVILEGLLPIGEHVVNLTNPGQ